MNTYLLPYALAGVLVIVGGIALLWWLTEWSQKHARQPEAPAPPSASAPLEVRSYRTAALFQADATSMAAAGWRIATQSSARVSHTGRGIVVGVLAGVVGLLLAGVIGLLVFGVIGGVAAGSGGGEVFTVTYQPGP